MEYAQVYALFTQNHSKCTLVTSVWNWLLTMSSNEWRNSWFASVFYNSTGSPYHRQLGAKRTWEKKQEIKEEIKRSGNVSTTQWHMFLCGVKKCALVQNVTGTTNLEFIFHLLIVSDFILVLKDILFPFKLTPLPLPCGAACEQYCFRNKTFVWLSWLLVITHFTSFNCSIKKRMWQS